MKAEEQTAVVPNDVPYVFDELDSRRVLVKFGRRVDHPRLGFVEPLRAALHNYDSMACDLTLTRTLVAGWIQVLHDLSIEGRDADRNIGIVAMHPDLQNSAGVLGYRDMLNLCETVEEVGDMRVTVWKADDAEEYRQKVRNAWPA